MTALLDETEARSQQDWVDIYQCFQKVFLSFDNYLELLVERISINQDIYKELSSILTKVGSIVGERVGLTVLK